MKYGDTDKMTFLATQGSEPDDGTYPEPDPGVAAVRGRGGLLVFGGSVRVERKIPLGVTIRLPHGSVK